MNFKRAQEIVKSPSHIEVLHQGRSVWITGLDAQNQTAEIQEGIDIAADKMEVPVDELIENGTMK
ncbi:small acid-soluble spore protein H family [Clostridium aceticum]|uniref:Small, acid-soluble spore protein H n=1 Tax=Clostridium aceticum TaxID=84022 RepID=A0A0D8IAW4_9CLOT|nr:H-type small acid-soluble spore protein [Clostridium aceticum]AKL96961.1 small acid-soluble spore protein H family [Clostridium aceticum]KJF27430.1 hypothetical protein TZ02_07795 [Clostridium aceticum]